MSESTASVHDDLCAKVAFLSRPQSYPDAGGRVEVIETHLSWVFLTRRTVYKLKKPLRYPYLDFSSLAARLHNCEEEVRLNRMLAPRVYLGVSRLCRQERRGFSLDGDGEVVEALVRMRRLPDGECLEVQLREGRASPAEVKLAAQRLADFYARSSMSSPADVARLRMRMTREAAELAELTEDRSGEVLRDALSSWLERHEGGLAARARREVHGDLRPQHVYLGRDPVFIDRLEFNRELRTLDPLEELAFFSLECERLRGGWVAECFFDAYRQRTGEYIPASLVAFYSARRALLWALLGARHITRGGDVEAWRRVARDYLQSGLAALSCG